MQCEIGLARLRWVDVKEGEEKLRSAPLTREPRDSTEVNEGKACQ